MCGVNIVHETMERFNVRHIDLSPPPLCVDDDATCVIGVMPGVDQYIDLPAYSADTASEVCVWCDAKISGQLIRDKAGNHPLINLPVRIGTLHCDKRLTR